MADDDAFAAAEDVSFNPEDQTAPSDAASAAPASAEKRAHPRVSVHWQGAVILNGRPVFGKITDVARGGMSFLCEAALPMSSKQLIFIRMPTVDRTGHHQLETLCQVCNLILVASQGVYRVGLKFLELRGDASTKLTQFLHANGG